MSQVMAMNKNSLIDRIEQLMSTTDTVIKSTEKKCEKLRIALSGTLRLLSGQKSTLTGVSGKPKDLRKYLVELVRDLEEESLDDLAAIQSELQKLLSFAKDSDYRTNIGRDENE
jgi:hypothetical protein